MGPNNGIEANTTTAFWTVDRVTSTSLTRSADAAIWRLHLLQSQGRTNGGVKLDLRYSENCGWVRRCGDDVEIRVVLRRLSGRALELS